MAPTTSLTLRLGICALAPGFPVSVLQGASKAPPPTFPIDTYRNNEPGGTQWCGDYCPGISLELPVGASRHEPGAARQLTEREYVV